jgi:phage shock protein E
VTQKMILLAVVAAAVLVGYMLLGNRKTDASAVRAQELVQGGARLVDVRTPEEFAAGHIAGAINVPLQQLDARVNELQPKDGALVVYCRSGRRSAEAASLLAAAGFNSVYDLGPMSRWPEVRE